jgi:hypothetical protein
VAAIFLGEKNNMLNDGFKYGEPRDENEKLIQELVESLDQVTSVFMKLNNSGKLTGQFFEILRDASIGYAGIVLRYLAEMLLDTDQLQYFLDECDQIFLSYTKLLRKENK